MSSIREAEPRELTEILALLQESRLPVEGVAEHLSEFLVAHDGETLLGVVGLERYEDIGLLRSLAVLPSARARGIGSQLVEAVVDLARRSQVSMIYLLTETAEDFFPRFGFQKIARESVDHRLDASAELQGACPETAVAMRKEITAVG